MFLCWRLETADNKDLFVLRIIVVKWKLRLTVMGMKKVEILLFDIGGVLVELGGIETMLEWTGRKYTAEGIMEVWLASPAVRLFESGQSDRIEFAGQIVKEFSLPVSVDTFLAEFEGWPTQTFPGVKQLLKNLKPHYRLVSLSNTNEIHWPRIMDTLGLKSFFDHQFPSHLTGLMKPDGEAFLKVIDDLKVYPESILFFDDSRTNIEKAQQIGLNAIRVQGSKEVESALFNAGLMKVA